MDDVRSKRKAWSWSIILGSLATIAAIVSGCIVVYDHFAPKKKELSYAVATTPLVAKIAGKPSALRIYYGTEQIEDVQSIQVIVQNTGDEAIRASDFDKPIDLAVTNARLLDARIDTRRPTNLPVHAELHADPGSVAIPSLLLNPGDQFTVALIVSGEAPGVSLNARIADIAAIRNTPSIMPTPRNSWESAFTWLAVAVIFVAVLCAITFVRFYDEINRALKEFERFAYGSTNISSAIVSPLATDNQGQENTTPRKG